MGEGETGPGPGLEKLDRRERGTWTNPCDFFISCLGYAVGLGRAELNISKYF